MAERYRIIAPLGRGGMGEVYRADDLKLGQAVAIKFLAPRLCHDPSLRQRFLDEVKIARQIAHPNVCRVYDVGEHNGQMFMTMAYVDGEDLACLLRRIGRVPREKAIQIAGQLCAGLAAIHAKGILHRDLKPANVMLDGRGQVHITDFGIATCGDDDPSRRRSGTVIYMAPEQLKGQSPSVRSDLYSLGLVLFELFTGRRVFDSATQRLREDATPPDPALLLDHMDPRVDDLIRQCLEPDPDDRPVSAQDVIISLPDFDLLNALVIAGTTPSPEMVAGAGRRFRLDRRVAWGLLGWIALGTGLLAWAADETMLFRRAGLTKPPEALVFRAEEILASIGFHGEPVQEDYGFNAVASWVDYLTETEKPNSWRRVHAGAPAAMFFWYRQIERGRSPPNGLIAVSPWEPPPGAPGSAEVILDPEGLLVELAVTPTTDARPFDSADRLEWRELFDAAGLDQERFRPVSPRGAPHVALDRRFAWEGTVRDAPETQLRVEAGSLMGRPAMFRLEGPWGGSVFEEPARNSRTHGLVFNLLYFVIIAGCLFEARRNLRHARGDRTGARRLAVCVFTIVLLEWVLSAHHSTEPYVEGQAFIGVVGTALFRSILLCWVPYMALEPHIRRLKPQWIISWTRLLAGRFRDSLVARDVLIGIATAVLLQGLLRLHLGLPGLLGFRSPHPETLWPDTLLGPAHYLADFLRFQPTAIFFGFGAIFLLLAARSVLRSESLASFLVVLLLTFLWYGEAPMGHPLINFLVTGARVAGVILVLRRWGVLATIVTIFFDFLLNSFPLTLNWSAWYAESAVFTVLVVIGTALCAYHFACRATDWYSPRTATSAT